MQEHLKETSRSKVLKKIIYIYILYMYIKWYDIQPLWLRRKKQKSYKKARYMFTIRFLCTVSKKINFPLNDVNKTHGASR